MQWISFQSTVYKSVLKEHSLCEVYWMHLYYLLSLIMVPFSACQLPSEVPSSLVQDYIQPTHVLRPHVSDAELAFTAEDAPMPTRGSARHARGFSPQMPNGSPTEGSASMLQITSASPNARQRLNGLSVSAE
jgi:hypothetical protein